MPQPGPGHVRIRTGACGVCATDLAMIAGWERTGFPAIPGHEWSGTVDAVGAGADSGLLGRRCVAENVLSDGGEVGFEHPGGYAEFLLTEAKNLHILPDDFPFPAATLIEPLAVCVRGMRRLRLQDRSAALVFGDGPIGLIMVMLLRRAEVEHVALVGGRAGRLALARELGAEKLLNYHEFGDDLPGAVEHAAGRSFPNVIEASGSAASIKAALQLVADCGKILVIGDYGEDRSEFRWNDLLHREMEIIGSNASAGAWPEAIRLATQDGLPLHRLVTHRFPAANFAEAIELAGSHRPDVVKVVLEWR